MVNDYLNVSDETLEEYFASLGVPRDLYKKLLYTSQINDKKELKKDLFCFFDENYYEDDYTVFIYDTCKYPPNSNPHKTLS
jgi:hypothetical protein